MSKKRPKPKYASREEVITALVTEPLQSGSFYDDDNCKVCAVGAVLRAHYKDSRITGRALELVGDNYSVAGDINAALAQKKYLGALSVFFEQQQNGGSYGAVTAEERMELVQFVMKHFPKKVRV